MWITAKPNSDAFLGSLVECLGEAEKRKPSFPSTLRKPNPLVLRKLDPLNAHLQVNILLLLVEDFVVVSL